MSTKVFLDANILLEVVHERQQLDAVLKLLDRHAGQTYISGLTIHLVMYFGRRVASREALQSLLSDHVVLPVGATETAWAFTNARNDDFEDALQLAAAIEGGCSTFVTLDKQLHKTYAGLPQIDVTLAA